MRYFMEFEVTRAELEDLKYSSRDNEEIVKQFSSEARNMAREMVADARILSHRDITAWFSMANVREAIRRIENSKYTKMQASDVMAEFENAGVLESMNSGHVSVQIRVLQALPKDGRGAWNAARAVLADQARGGRLWRQRGALARGR